MTDEQLDLALKGYVAEEPRSGFEDRILVRIRQAKRAPRWPWLLPAIGAAALAMSVFAIGLHRPAPLPAGVVWVRPDPVPPLVFTHLVSSPKPAVPKPPALSPAQRTLLQWVESDPETALELLSESRHEDLRPLVFEPLIVTPLTSQEQQQ